MRTIWCVSLAAALAACGRESKPRASQEAPVPNHDDHSAPPPAGQPAAPAAPAAPAVDRELDVASVNLRARVRVKVPATWTVSGLQVVLRDQYQEAIAGVQFTVTCDGACGDDEIAKLPQLVDQTFETRSRPNIGTGDPALDAVRMKVEIVDQGDVPNGKFRVGRITKPADVQGPYRNQLYAVCARAKPGSKIVAAQAWAPLDKEAELGPVIVAACKTFEIL
ncbi:MAG TPA: hypothetical protein VHT91_13235 [Kofleriaceae bacterium]|jgi:hypothetical protein|nr:hypothetical protein [Kofleriaceae bacterium]